MRASCGVIPRLAAGFEHADHDHDRDGGSGEDCRHTDTAEERRIPWRAGDVRVAGMIWGCDMRAAPSQMRQAVSSLS
jgi:hypothetical protein